MHDRKRSKADISGVVPDLTDASDTWLYKCKKSWCALIMAGMGAVYHYEELRAIIGRMNLLLPPSPSDQDAWGTYPHLKGNKTHPVIESNAISTHRLSLGVDKKWQFRNNGIKLCEGQAARRSLVQSETSFLTSMDDHPPESVMLFPPGVSLWHSSDHARRIIPMVRHDLKDLFDSVKSDNPWRIPCYHVDGPLFHTPRQGQLCFHGCMRLISGRLPYLHRFCLEGAAMASHMYGLHLTEFGMVSRLEIHKHDTAEGTPMSLWDSLQARYDGGPVLVICLGLPLVNHDMAPTLPSPDNSSESPVRIVVPEGVMMAIDGDARFRYAHGFPKGQEGAACFFSIRIFMDCIQQTGLMGYERETRTLVMTTPMVRDHIISTRPELQSRTNVHNTLQRDTLWRLVQQMRTRLRMTESFSIAQPRACTESQRRNSPNDTGVSGSSRIMLE